MGTATVPGAVVASFDDHTGDAPTVPTAVDELTCELADGTTWTLHGRVVAAARDGRDF